MYTRGEFSTNGVTYGALVRHTRQELEIVLVTSGTVVSAYRSDSTGTFSYNNVKAKEMAQILKNGLKGCSSKNSTPVPFELGAMNQHEFTKAKVNYTVQLYMSELAGASIETSVESTSPNKIKIELEYIKEKMMPDTIPYVKITEVSKNETLADSDLDTIRTRSIQEIALEKEDLTWLKKKKYYIVNDDEQAEKLFTFLDGYNGPIAYDTETTGLHINCFGKVGSSYKEKLQKYNDEHPDDQIRADKVVGIIFCVQDDTSYYFPVNNRKFKNLYEDINSPVRQKIVADIKTRYTIGDKRDSDGDMRKFLKNTPSENWGCDVILFERVRDILEKHHIVTHNGQFDWKVSWQYEVDTNLTDDTMIMHKLMYKFRSTTSNEGESSGLKDLAKRELNTDQWELEDFFPDWKPDKDGLIREKPGQKHKGTQIDFSYMDYQGTQVYAPADGDITFQLFEKYKKDLVENHKDMEYLYRVEMIVACCMGYMEFYGHRIDEAKIEHAKIQTKTKIKMLESQIRQCIGYSGEAELASYNEINSLNEKLEAAEKAGNKDEQATIEKQLDDEFAKLVAAIENDHEHELNLNSPAQVGDLFYDIIGLPLPEDGKKSVGKKVIKQFVKEKDENGKPKYPAVALYSEYKAQITLDTKFFDNLPYFMYPGGFIFSSFGQISTATGRMSCSKPNAQQYPKVITKIIYPRDGYAMLDADYSQIEYRVLTALAKNDGLAKLFSSPDSDYHTLMASLMYEVPYASVTPVMRSSAKSFNFGIPYGMGFKSLALLLTGNSSQKSVDEAKEKYNMYFKNQPRTKQFFENVKEMALVNKYTKTLFNRYRYYTFTDKDGNVDKKRKGAALRQAGNAVIQGTAADIFKISVARNFSYIRKNHLLGKLLIINMIHDEQLFEIDIQHLNMLRILTDVGKNMQFHIDGFPPLYIGAGIGPAWGYAKGKMAEIHPTLLAQLTEEAKDIPIYREDCSTPVDVKQAVADFSARVKEFRRQKVADYLSNPENWHKVIYPAVGGLINLQFNYGRGDEAKAYIGPNGEKYDDTQFLQLNIADFIKENNLDCKAEYFTATEVKQDEPEEEKEYTDDQEAGDDELDVDGGPDTFSVARQIDESSKTFGSSIQDLINIFGACILEKQKICGINTKDVTDRQKDKIIDYIMKYVSDTDTGYEVVFLTSANVLKHTGIFVAGINEDALDKVYKNIMRTA